MYYSYYFITRHSLTWIMWRKGQILTISISLFWYLLDKALIHICLSPPKFRWSKKEIVLFLIITEARQKLEYWFFKAILEAIETLFICNMKNMSYSKLEDVYVLYIQDLSISSVPYNVWQYNCGNQISNFVWMKEFLLIVRIRTVAIHVRNKASMIQGKGEIPFLRALSCSCMYHCNL